MKFASEKMNGVESEEKYIVRLKFQNKFMFVNFRETELTTTNFPEKGELHLAILLFIKLVVYQSII